MDGSLLRSTASSCFHNNAFLGHLYMCLKKCGCVYLFVVHIISVSLFFPNLIFRIISLAVQVWKAKLSGGVCRLTQETY